MVAGVGKRSCCCLGPREPFLLTPGRGGTQGGWGALWTLLQGPASCKTCLQRDRGLLPGDCAAAFFLSPPLKGAELSSSQGGGSLGTHHFGNYGVPWLLKLLGAQEQDIPRPLMTPNDRSEQDVYWLATKSQGENPARCPCSGYGWHGLYPLPWLHWG